MQRYFSLSDIELTISNDDIHHILNVMRSKIGDKFEVVFDSKIYLCSLSSVKPFGYNIVEIYENNNELPNDLTLFYALSKGDKNEFVMQKATELGVKKIVLVSTKRCVAKMTNEDFDRKLIRFNKIIKEAAEQSKRNVLPKIVGVYSIFELKALMCDHNFVAYEDTDILSSNPVKCFSSIKNGESISVLIGSEGGLAKEEVEQLNNLGFINISLGKRILRTETAAVYALSLIGSYLEFHHE